MLALAVPVAANQRLAGPAGLPSPGALAPINVETVDDDVRVV